MIQKTAYLLRFLGKLSHKWLGFVPSASIAAVLAVAGVQMMVSAPAHQAELPDYSAFDGGLFDQSIVGVQGAAFSNDSSPMGEFSLAESDNDFAGFVLVDKGSLVNSPVPSSNTKASAGGLLTYKVGLGDNLSTISSKFGISVNTIVWSNNLKTSNFLKPGQEIIILPVSGVLHDVKTGETIDTIAELYNVSARDIKTFNKSKISAGDTVIVPNVKPIKQTLAVSILPDVGDYLAFPVSEGYNWGKLHLSAVDISAACGTSIYAAAEGLVEAVGNVNNWNDGLGGYVRIKHPLNNVETVYAHTSKNIVSVGDYISRGDQIALIGNTGKVQGPTGCHVHFAVHGAKHPFAK
ncbi:MAG: hypothetical protein A3B23_02565 [Candidatus Colwellbacteria bacterium RIFCSPLOWO2_01_FULL_48_10]|uniref:LysM domain-containing protein n=2 Tax=Bacteria candidate phyla TaxID=1783234 RepID=A0A1G1Z7W3_9BACT|nr:MAG: hypothetical protein A3B23_02565 [Candidatus Colwellbacteria bacterium RIFCSPLOWO2_01_FULL_48_10]